MATPPKLQEVKITQALPKNCTPQKSRIQSSIILRAINIETYEADPDQIANLNLQELATFCVKCNRLLSADVEKAILCAKWASIRAFLLGRALVHAKKLVGHGDWEKWIENYLQGTSIETARRYMRLAKGDKQSVLSAKGLCSAYRASGILPADASAKSDQPHKDLPKNRAGRRAHRTLESFIDRLVCKLEKQNLGVTPISQELTDKLARLQSLLEPLLHRQAAVNTRWNFPQNGQVLPLATNSNWVPPPSRHFNS